MAFKAKIKGSDGRCCCGGGVCIIFCSVRGGLASLCGKPEYVSPSVPPKKYRSIASGGTGAGNLYDNSDCTGFNHEDSCTYSGTLTYDKDTCATSHTGSVACEIAGVGQPL